MPFFGQAFSLGSFVQRAPGSSIIRFLPTRVVECAI
jgi:hypothetical protein